MNDQVCRSTPREDPDRIVGTLFPRGRTWRPRWCRQGAEMASLVRLHFRRYRARVLLRTRGGQARVHETKGGR